jgi:serine/threonine protein phosphatase PrpC
MRIKACICTDVGKSRKINQDSALVKVANTKKHGRISLVAVCDGMGGLSKGEIASCKAIRTLESWFHEELILLQNLDTEELWRVIEESFRRMVVRISGELKKYGKHRGISLGTTMTALFQMGNRYIVVNVGDSRLYAIRGDKVYRLTKDQSVLQDKLDKGLITPREALYDDQKSVLLQCIGSSAVPVPEIRKGEFEGSTTIIACTDGFWRTMNEEELYQKLCPQMCVSGEDMLLECKKMVKDAMDRDEDDNISVAAVCMEF